MTTVFNLATAEERTYSLPPAEAVIAAYAQGRGDWNTWDYASRYTKLLVIGKASIACGDWATSARS